MLKTSTAAAALFTLAFALPASAQLRVSEVGLSVAPTWAFSGPSPLEEMSFKHDFDTGLSFGAYAVGPISEVVGWRIELGRERMPADADRTGGRIDGDYSVLRWQLGVQVQNYEDHFGGWPYLFATMGLARQDASITIEDIDLDPSLPTGDLRVDLDGTSNFGMSFGGGYNYMLGDNWGIGGDLHINVGLFADGSRWWWTPSGQIFYSW